MIRTNEEIVELKQEIEASRYLTAYKNRLRDLFDTIADLQRQLAERDDAIVELEERCVCGHPGGRVYNGRHFIHPAEGGAESHPTDLDAYVQQRVDEAVLAATETLEHQHQCAVDVPVSELQEWYEKYINNMAARPCLPSCPKCKVFAAARSHVQDKPEGK